MENLNEKLKLPSNWAIVTPESIWRHLQAISKAGHIFNKEQLIKAGLYTSNDDNISRNLSYLKYMQIVEEERGKGKDQRFKVIDSKKVKDILYELKANRETSAKSKLREHLEDHPLFVTLKADFFKSDNQRTLNDLEHFLRDGLPGKAPQYYQKGGEFLIKLLHLAQLATIEGNDITLSEREYSKNEALINEDNKGKNRENVELSPIEEVAKQIPMSSSHMSTFQDIQIIPTTSYVIQFTGPGMNSKLEIQEVDDFVIVEATLAKIKKKLAKDEIN